LVSVSTILKNNSTTDLKKTQQLTMSLNASPVEVVAESVAIAEEQLSFTELARVYHNITCDYGIGVSDDVRTTDINHEHCWHFSQLMKCPLFPNYAMEGGIYITQGKHKVKIMMEIKEAVKKTMKRIPQDGTLTDEEHYIMSAQILMYSMIDMKAEMDLCNYMGKEMSERYEAIDKILKKILTIQQVEKDWDSEKIIKFIDITLVSWTMLSAHRFRDDRKRYCPCYDLKCLYVDEIQLGKGIRDTPNWEGDEVMRQCRREIDDEDCEHIINMFRGDYMKLAKDSRLKIARENVLSWKKSGDWDEVTFQELDNA